MAVIGTPVDTPAPPADACDAQGTSSAAITKLYGIDLPTKRRAASVSAGTKAVVQLQLYDGIGNPVDLEDCAGEEGEVAVKIREVILTRARDIYTVAGTVVDVGAGIVQFTTPNDVKNNPGVYNCELGVTDGDTAFTYVDALSECGIGTKHNLRSGCTSTRAITSSGTSGSNTSPATCSRSPPTVIVGIISRTRPAASQSTTRTNSSSTTRSAPC